MKLLIFCGLVQSFHTRTTYEDCSSPTESQQCVDTCIADSERCVQKCQDESCTTQCKRRGLACTEHCPCNTFCPNGCDGCSNWSCQKNTTVLILNQYDETHFPFLFEMGGEGQLDQLAFTYEEGTSSFRSCSNVYRGHMTIVGGLYPKFNAQVSVVDGCSLKRVATLPNHHDNPGCNTFFNEIMEPVMYICFSREDQTGCLSFDGTEFVSEASANYGHFFTALGNYQNEAVVVGGLVGGAIGNTKMEVKRNGKWYDEGDFPYGQIFFYGYSFVNFRNDLILFGGSTFDQNLNYVTLDLALKYDGTYSQIGTMLKTRGGHRTIANANSILHIGGGDEKETFEIWQFDDESENFTMKAYAASLDAYKFYPESFFVPAQYCQ